MNLLDTDTHERNNLSKITKIYLMYISQAPF